jgi:hypothetical protein
MSSDNSCSASLNQTLGNFLKIHQTKLYLPSSFKNSLNVSKQQNNMILFDYCFSKGIITFWSIRLWKNSRTLKEHARRNTILNSFGSNSSLPLAKYIINFLTRDWLALIYKESINYLVVWISISSFLLRHASASSSDPHPLVNKDLFMLKLFSFYGLCRIIEIWLDLVW